MESSIDFQEISNELIRLLCLKSKNNLSDIIKTAKIHVREKSFFISFEGTNKFEIAILNRLNSISQTLRGQSYPNLFELTRASILKSCDRNILEFVKRDHTAFENLITKRFLSDLLLNIIY